MHPTRKPKSPWRYAFERMVATENGALIVQKIVFPIDQYLLRATRGRLSLGRILSPVALLTTTGAKSGLPRTTPLLYVRDGARIVLIASFYGRPRHPAWYCNLRANPTATLDLAGRSGTYTAHEATGAERQRLWEQAVNFYAGYEIYARRAGNRQIPIMVLTPEA